MGDLKEKIKPTEQHVRRALNIMGDMRSTLLKSFTNVDANGLISGIAQALADVQAETYLEAAKWHDEQASIKKICAENIDDDPETKAAFMQAYRHHTISAAAHRTGKAATIESPKSPAVEPLSEEAEDKIRMDNLTAYRFDPTHANSNELRLLATIDKLKADRKLLIDVIIDVKHERDKARSACDSAFERGKEEGAAERETAICKFMRENADSSEVEWLLKEIDLGTHLVPDIAKAIRES